MPDAQFYDRLYGRGRWKASTTISNAIGQGEITVTPMHLANLAAVVANRGYYYRPHIIRSIDGQAIDTAYTQRIETGLAREHFDVVARGMANVFRAGTAREYAIPQAQFCGKTGTVENFVRIDGRLVQLPDHGMFVAFGPEEDPKIAITVVVENGRFGRIWAAPIASLMMERYLLGKTNRPELEKRIMEGSLEEVYRQCDLLREQAKAKKK